MEDELGLLLIDRSTYRPSLTTYGKQLLEKSIPVLDSFKKLESFATTLSKNQELKLQLSMTALWPIDKISPVLKQVNQKFHETEITFTTEILSGEELLLSEKVDMAILESVENRFDIEYKQIGQVDMPLLLASGHTLASKENLKADDLRVLPQVIVRSTLPSKGKTIGVDNQTKKWYVSDLDSKLKLILEGLGWGRLPDHVANEYLQRQCLIEVEPEKQKFSNLQIYIARRKNDFHGLVSNYIWENI